MTDHSPGRLFTAGGAWSGGFYELTFFYPPGSDLDEALAALWSFSELTGPVASRTAEPWDQPPIEPAAHIELDGVLSLSGAGRTACATFVSERDTGSEVTFGIPLGSLGHAWPEIGAFPFGTTAAHAEAWEPRLEQLLVRLAGHLHARAPFLRALTSFEGMDWDYDDPVTRPGPVPVSHGAGIIDVDGAELAWYPPTIRGGFLPDSGESARATKRGWRQPERWRIPLSGRALAKTARAAFGRRHSSVMSAGLPAATIVASFSHSECNACGGGCIPSEKKHITRLAGYGGTPGKGCGIEFTHISTPSLLAQSKNAARALRPDLEYIEFSRNE